MEAVRLRRKTRRELTGRETVGQVDASERFVLAHFKGRSEQVTQPSLLDRAGKRLRASAR